MKDKENFYHKPHEPSIRHLLLKNKKSGIAVINILGIKNRNQSKSSYLLVWFVVNLIFLSCSRQGLNDNLLIAVSIPPQAWFVSQLAGDKADVLVLVPPGQNPHNYEPTPRQIQSLSKARVWILSGTEFEISLRPKIERLFPDLIIVDGTDGVEFRYLTEQESHDCDDHDHDHFPHSSLEIDRHTWLGLRPASLLIDSIFNTLLVLDEENIEFYFNNLQDVMEEINLVFDELKEMLAPLRGISVFVYHPSFGYFLDDFGIIQEAVEMGGKEPTPRQLNNLMERIKEEKPAAIFVQKQFPVNAARTLAQTAGAQVIELDPLAQDWLENIKRMGQALKNIIQ